MRLGCCSAGCCRIGGGGVRGCRHAGTGGNGRGASLPKGMSTAKIVGGKQWRKRIVVEEDRSTEKRVNIPTDRVLTIRKRAERNTFVERGKSYSPYWRKLSRRCPYDARTVRPTRKRKRPTKSQIKQTLKNPDTNRYISRRTFHPFSHPPRYPSQTHRYHSKTLCATTAVAQCPWPVTLHRRV